MTPSPLRLLTAVPICDGHDSAINTINLELIRHGIEVVYLGYHRPASEIVRAAIQEDVRAVGLSSYNGGHIEFFAEVRQRLDAQGATHIGLFGGGGGTITLADAELMTQQGTDRIFFAGTPLDDMLAWIAERYGGTKTSNASPSRDLALAERLTAAESAVSRPVADPLAEVSSAAKTCRVVGITGPGGAGKTTLIDELVLRFLRIPARPRAHGHPLARSQHRRQRRGRAARRPRDDDLLAKRPGLHALDGDARPVRRTQPFDGSMPRNSRGLRRV